jgi:integrase
MLYDPNTHAHKPIPPAVWKKVIEASKSDPLLYTWLMFLRGTGARAGEAGAIAKKNVDLSRGVVCICEAFQHGQNGEAVVGKIRIGGRTTVILPEAVKALETFMANQSEGQRKSERVFVLPNGKLPLRDFFPTKLRRLLNSLCVQGEINKEDIFSANNIRLTYMAEILNMGARASAVAKLMGSAVETISATVCREVTGSSPVAVEGTYNHKDSQI